MYVTYSSFRKRLDSPSISFNLYKITIYYLNFFVNKTNKNTKTILLAGSSGYIGRNVLNTLLSRGYQVVCIGRNFSDPYALRKQKDVVFYKIDLCSKNDFKNLSEKFSSIHAIISCIGTRSGGYKDSWNVEYKSMFISTSLLRTETKLFNECWIINGPFDKLKRSSIFSQPAPY